MNHKNRTTPANDETAKPAAVKTPQGTVIFEDFSDEAMMASFNEDDEKPAENPKKD